MWYDLYEVTFISLTEIHYHLIKSSNNISKSFSIFSALKIIKHSVVKIIFNKISEIFFPKILTKLNKKCFFFNIIFNMDKIYKIREILDKIITGRSIGGDLIKLIKYN